ncbi:helix-turn-helix domain-containing protein [Streptomyces sp. AJS327]|uniref:helix-turn-helix domain-containing protein n=1 Tax=Streptomyces sp. AJS327 TaxID=2545265 RepID=UPI0015DFD5D0|nr:helix-turn-helix domain-containing protein [Streptomyces sp. AJS327]
MTGASASDHVLDILELLAAEAPPSAVDNLVETARGAEMSSGDVKRLERARELALALHTRNSRQQQREAGMVRLVDALRDLAAAPDLDELTQDIVRQARLLLNLDTAYLGFRDSSTGRLHIRVVDGHVTRTPMGLEIPATEAGPPPNAAGAPFWTPDYLADQRVGHVENLDRMVRAEGLRALISVALRDGSEMIGALFLGARTVRYFTHDEVSLASSFATLAAVSIRRTRLSGHARTRIAGLKAGLREAENHVTLLRRSNDAQSKLMELALHGSGVRAVLAEAADALGGPLLLRGTDGEVIASTGEMPVTGDRELTRVIFEAHAARSALTLGNGFWIAPVIAGREGLGTLILHSTETVDECCVRLLRLTAQLCALLLLMPRSLAVTEVQLRDEFFDDLLIAPPWSLRQLTERSHRLAVDLSAPHVLVTARVDDGLLSRAGVWATSYANRLNGLKSVRDDCLVFLLPGTDASQAARSVHAELSALLDRPVTVSAAGPGSDPAAVADLHQEARHCLEALTALGGTGSSASAQDLGFLGVLLSRDYDIGGFISTTLGPVLEYDRERRTDLTRTLYAYFDAGQRPKYAAELLHVHVNTVSRRLERLTELLGADWQEPGRALEIQLAARVHRIQHTLTARQ